MVRSERYRNGADAAKQAVCSSFSSQASVPRWPCNARHGFGHCKDGYVNCGHGIPSSTRQLLNQHFSTTEQRQELLLPRRTNQV